ncbi:EF-HAND CALCIUM-BINDING DOMAIN CONTAINING PROTEIN [Salix viminalis]|uniref:EF-HAND CALCIUM-BINDING DOMAIN CONTAINING PROTEIN n=1 Tax=Salix viminalis TaxID=40686 RepID=A0A9Q0NTV4_SALVM|nr:EF-HAND CALCIUM-BINDING DOMAIN CONTAINING PROTEIN [Salix viminalis]
MFPWTIHPKNIDKGCSKPVTLAAPHSEEQLNKILFPSTHRLKNIDKGCGKPVTLTLASPLDEEQLNKIFDRFDSNGDGHLSWEELKSAYNILGMSFPGLRALKALRVADENRDGYISQKEFIKLTRKNPRK